MTTVEHIKLLYRGVPEDGFTRDIECPAEVITKLHKRTGLDFDSSTLLIKGLQIVRSPNCTEQAFRNRFEQQRLQNWETEDFIVFENIYYGVYSTVIVNTINKQVKFPVYICDKTKSHTRFYKSGVFTIVQNVRPDTLTMNSNGHTVRGYLLLQKYVPPVSKWEKLKEESLALSQDLKCFQPRLPVLEEPSDSKKEPSAAALAVRVVEEKEVVGMLEDCFYSRATEVYGIQFKSLLEARFAVFLHNVGLEFTYEKSMFSLEAFDRSPGHTHTYHPDFYIKSMRLQVELKPHFPHVEELDLCEQLALLGYDVVLFYGSDFVPLFQNYNTSPGHTKRHYAQQNAIRGIGWSGQTGGRIAGEAVFVENEGTVRVECITSVRNVSFEKLQSPKLLAAYEAARALK
jgi:hypothetical protein